MRKRCPAWNRQLAIFGGLAPMLKTPTTHRDQLGDRRRRPLNSGRAARDARASAAFRIRPASQTSGEKHDPEQDRDLPMVRPWAGARRRGVLCGDPSPTAVSAPATLRRPSCSSGRPGNELTVEFTVLGMPFVGLNGGPQFKFNEAISFQVYTGGQEETNRYWDAIVENGGEEGALRLVQGQVGPILAEIVPRAAPRLRRGHKAAAKRAMEHHDGHEKDRHRPPIERAWTRGPGVCSSSATPSRPTR